jgi:hypothetical protein
MRTSSNAMAAGLIALAMTAGGAQAQEAMATAGATGAAIPEASANDAPSAPAVAPLDDTAAQIQRWIAESPARSEDGQSLDLRRDRQVHGEVGVAVGTGGYRSAYVTSVMPIGERGTLALSIGQSRNVPGLYRGAYGYPYGEVIGLGIPGDPDFGPPLSLAR